MDDLGQLLGCGAYVTRLHRTHVADYPNERMMTIEELEALARSNEDGSPMFDVLDEQLLSMDSAVSRLPKVSIDAESRIRFGCGNPVAVSEPSAGLVRVYQGDCFLGVAEYQHDQVQPKRLVVYQD